MTNSIPEIELELADALKRMDEEKYFDTGKQRENWFLNVEVNPPDGSNLLRAEHLNSKEKIQEWLDSGGG